MKFLPYLLSFFLVMLIPQPKVSPLLENYEEKETLTVDAPVLPVMILALVQLIHEFPEFLPLAPQSRPAPSARPPALPLS